MFNITKDTGFRRYGNEESPDFIPLKNGIQKRYE
jgi:hypothetical protein